MKKLFISLAVLLMCVGTISAQNREAAKALKELDKAKQNVEKKPSASAWLKLGDAYAACYEAPITGVFLDASAMQTQMLMKGQQKLGSEQTEINGKVITVDTYSDKKLYIDENGNVMGFKILEEITPAPLAEALKAYSKAAEAGASEKDLKPSLTNLAQKFWTLGMSNYRIGDFLAASESFENSYRVNSMPAVGEADGESLYYSGFTAFYGKDTKRAQALLNECLSKGIDQKGDVYSLLADSYKSTGDTAKCKSLLAEGFEKFPTNQGILVSLINTYLESKDDPEKVLAVLHKAQENEPNNASLFYAEGNLYRTMKNYEKAIEFFRKSAELDPKYVFAPYSEGDTYYSIALEIQEKASMEADDNKYNQMLNEMNDCLKKAIEPFERAFSITDDVEIKKACAEYLKQIFFRFRDESPEYQQKHAEYVAFLGQ